MDLFTIDETFCRKDGACVAECPAFVIEMKTPDSFPTLAEGGEARCIGCGHCVAVCPHSAFSHRLMEAGECPTVDHHGILSAEQAEHFLRSRRSIRSYLEKDVETGKLERLVEIARYAPTGSNSQDVRWLVVAGRGEVARLTGMAVDWMRHMVRKSDPAAEGYGMAGIVHAHDSGTDIICRGAPSLIVAAGRKGYPVAVIDSTIAMTFLDLAAPTLGLGTCWAGFFMAAAANWPPLAEALALPEGYAPFTAMMVGYPKYRYRRLPKRSEPRITWQG